LSTKAPNNVWSFFVLYPFVFSYSPRQYNSLSILKEQAQNQANLNHQTERSGINLK